MGTGSAAFGNRLLIILMQVSVCGKGGTETVQTVGIVMLGDVMSGKMAATLHFGAPHDCLL